MNDSKSLLDLPEVYQETLCMHMALLQLGVDSEHIFFSVSLVEEVAGIETTGDVSVITPRLATGATVTVVVKSDGAESDPLFTVGIGPAPADFHETWPEACRRWNELSRGAMLSIWEASNVRQNVAALITALTLSGMMRNGRVVMGAAPTAQPAATQVIPTVNARGGRG